MHQVSSFSVHIKTHVDTVSSSKEKLVNLPAQKPCLSIPSALDLTFTNSSVLFSLGHTGPRKQILNCSSAWSLTELIKQHLGALKIILQFEL